eukprot:gene22682-28827_t
MVKATEIEALTQEIAQLHATQARHGHAIVCTPAQLQTSATIYCGGVRHGGEKSGLGLTVNVDAPQRYYYVGSYHNNMKHGQGTEFSPEGTYIGHGVHRTPQDVYEGNFVNGMRHGEGCITFPNGYVYQGEFVNGLRHGMGIATDVTGLRRNGGFASAPQFASDHVRRPTDTGQRSLTRAPMTGLAVGEVRKSSIGRIFEQREPQPTSSVMHVRASAPPFPSVHVRRPADTGQRSLTRAPMTGLA